MGKSERKNKERTKRKGWTVKFVEVSFTPSKKASKSFEKMEEKRTIYITTSRLVASTMTQTTITMFLVHLDVHVADRLH